MSIEAEHRRRTRIHIDRKPHESENPTTGLALYQLGNVPEGHELYREERGDHEDKPVPKGHERIELKEDEHFYSAKCDGPKLVEITVNATERKIQSGVQTVVTIKEVGKVPLADDLEQIVDGKLMPLADTGSVDIKGGEKFVSHPKDSGSSNH